MITFYRTLLFVSVLVFVGSLLLPASHGIPISKRLSRHVDDWSFTFNTTNHLLIGATEEQSKAMLLQYFREHEIADQSLFGGFTLVAAVAGVFSLVGWRREVRSQKEGQKL